MRILTLLLLVGLIVVSSGCIGSTGDQLGDAFIRVAEVICYLFVVVKSIAGVIAVLLIIIAGLKWTGSQENPEERTKAKKMVEGILIGLFIVGLAVVIVGAIVHASGYKCGEGGVSILIPKKV